MLYEKQIVYFFGEAYRIPKPETIDQRDLCNQKILKPELARQPIVLEETHQSYTAWQNVYSLVSLSQNLGRPVLLSI